ncbi:MICAL-like protein 2a isoform X1 [Gadus morhua]|uniref:Mical-like 2a n=2 Tax=Gadus morhua TaxID=8049 RepID=A0A8C5FLM9_GADMO|nr:MICAL-like protein 2 isoform X1 [Gadus morhua]
MSAIKALEKWCKMQCDGYQDVAINNMTTSFKNGMAFCALIHKYRPDLIDYESLKKEDVFQNNHLAFRIAEEKLGIPALLDAEDMVALRVPDRLSILTYVSQYYNYFNGRSAIGGVKRPAEGSKENLSKKNLPMVSKTFVSKTATEKGFPSPHVTESSPGTARASSATAEKTATPGNTGKSGTLNSKCVACQSHVHLVQRHFVDGKLYHRSCFRCSDCSGTLRPGAYRVGSSPDTFVCKSHQRDQQQSEPKAVSSTATAPTDPDPLVSSRSNAFKPASTAQSNGHHPHHHHHRDPPASIQRPDANRPTLAPRPTSVSQTPPAPRPVSVSTNPVAYKAADVSSVSPATPVTSLTSATPVTSLTPVTPVSSPANKTADHSTPLSLSAQKTQAARQRFFQTGRAGPVAEPPWAHMKPPGPADVHSHSPGAKEKSGNQPAQENCNNNNVRHFTVRSAKRRFGGDPSPDGGASFTQETSTQGKEGTQRGQPTAVEASGPKAVQMDENRLTTVGNTTTDLTACQDRRSKLKLVTTDPERRSSDVYVGEEQDEPQTAPEESPATVRATAVAPEVFQPDVPLVDPPCGSLLIPAEPQTSLAMIRVTAGCPSPNPACSPRTPANQKHLHLSGSPGTKRGKYLSPANASKTEMRSTIIRCHHIPTDQIVKELGDIEEELGALEKEGVELEKKLRSCEEDAGGDILMDPIMVEWFNLIRKKQVYIRKESELVYIARIQDLEVQQPGVEAELRILLGKPDSLKSAADQEREEKLMGRLVEIVNGRNAIVQVLDEDRLREVEEDQQLNNMMQSLGVKKSPKRRKSSVSKLFRRRSKRAVD